METNFKVMLVDDEPDFLETNSKRLRRRGFSVVTALDCAQALAAMEADVVDVVVLDVMLPEVDGVECLKEMKKTWPHVAVILLTGHASIPAGLESVELGAVDYCLKPIDFEELVEKIVIAHRES